MHKLPLLVLLALLASWETASAKPLPELLNGIFRTSEKNPEELGVNAFVGGCLETNLNLERISDFAAEQDWKAISETASRRLPWGVLGPSIQGWSIDRSSNSVALVAQAGGGVSREAMADFKSSRNVPTRKPIDAAAADATNSVVGRIDCSVHIVATTPVKMIELLERELGVSATAQVGGRKGIGKQIGMDWELFQFSAPDFEAIYFSYDASDRSPFLPNATLKVSRNLYAGEPHTF